MSGPLTLSVSVCAFIALSRNSVNQLPCKLLVPLLVTMFITPPLLRPYSALERDVIDVELLNRFEREELQQAADGVVVVVAAVDLVVDVAAVAAADLRRVLRALGRVGVEAEADAGNRRREVGELPPVERHALDAPDVDDAADRRGRGLDERRLAGDRDRLGHDATFNVTSTSSVWPTLSDDALLLDRR